MNPILTENRDEYFINGLEKYKLQDYKGAIEDYNRAIEINHLHPWSYNSRGEAKRKLNDFTGAIADHTISIENYPTHTGGYILRGYAKNTLGDKNGACTDWDKAVELGEKDALYLIKLFYG